MKRGLTMTLAEAEAHQMKHFGKFIPEAKEGPMAAPKPLRGPNKTEAEFGRILEARLQKGEIDEYAFEPFSLKYGEDAYYKPDWVTRNGGLLTIKEVAALCNASAIDLACDSGLHGLYLAFGMKPSGITVIEVKGGHIYPEAKPRFKAAKLRHRWADFELHQKKARTWTRLL